MGLDMYAYKRKTIETNSSEDDPWGEDVESIEEEEIFYWRKHPDLHGWMENLYYEKGGNADSFNCVNVFLTLDDLDRLEDDVLNENLEKTTGFFFGESDPSRKKDDLKFIRMARKAIDDGYEVYYTSWW